MAMHKHMAVQRPRLCKLLGTCGLNYAMYITNQSQAFGDEARSWKSAEPVFVNSLRRKLIGRVSNFHIPDSRPDIFMFSSPRSGSTFLLEALSRQPGLKVFDEPLGINDPIVRQELGIHSWHDATVLPNRKAVYGRYFRRLMKNRLTAFNVPLYRKGSRLVTHRNFFKILHGGEDMLDWFEQALGGRILILLRHPVAVSLSHWKLPRLRFLLEQEDLRRHLSYRQVKFAERIIETGSPFELAITDWCLQNFLLTRKRLPDSWTRISYEETVLHPQEMFDNITLRLALSTSAYNESEFKRPSKTVIKREDATRAAIRDGTSESRQLLVKKWKHKISPEQTSRASEILGQFSIDYYSAEDALPSPAYLWFPELCAT